MKNLRLLSLLCVAVLMLAACSPGDTVITFRNRTECGTATVTLTHSGTGNERTYTVEQGKNLEITVENGVADRYQVVYERLPGPLQCDSKSGTVLLPNRGDSAAFTLESIAQQPESTPAG